MTGPVLAADAPAPSARPTDALRIVTIARAPYVFIESGQPVSGFTIDLIAAIAEKIGRPLQYQVVDRFSDLLDQVRDGHADVAAANISITASREATLDFSQPIFDSGLRILMRAGSASPSLWRLVWESGVLTLVGAAAGVLLLAAHLMWLLERGAQPYFRRSYPGGVWDAFWWAFVIVTMGGFERERPVRPLARIFAIAWILVGLLFVSTFTAKLTTSLTVGQLTDSVRDWRDLGGRKLGIAVGTTMERFARAQHLPFMPYPDFSQALIALEKSEVDAIIGDDAVARHYVAGAGRGKLRLAGEVFAPDKIGLALAQGSPLREPIDRALLGLIEDGSYGQIRERYFDSR